MWLCNTVSITYASLKLTNLTEGEVKVGRNDYDEKSGGKREEKEQRDVEKREEKSAEEKWQRDPIGALAWACILIWAGVVLLASNLGAFDLLEDFAARLPFNLANLPWESGMFPVEAWTFIWLGASAILFLSVLARLFFPQYRRSITGNFVLAFVFLGIAIGRWEWVGPLILVAIGIGIVLRGLGRSRGKE